MAAFHYGLFFLKQRKNDVILLYLKKNRLAAFLVADSTTVQRSRSGASADYIEWPGTHDQWKPGKSR